MVSGHTSPAGSQRYDPISWRQHSRFAWSSTYSSKLLWNVRQTNKFLKTNKYSLKRANVFRFFCRTIPIVFAWKFCRNIFVLKNPCWLILKPCKFVIPKWKQGSMKCLDNEEKSECSQAVKLKFKLIFFTVLVGSLWILTCVGAYLWHDHLDI